MHHPCLLATAYLLLILAFPPGKHKSLQEGTFSHSCWEAQLSVPLSPWLFLVQFISLTSRADKTCHLSFFSEIDTTGIANGRTHLHQHVGVFQVTRGRWMRGETEEETELWHPQYHLFQQWNLEHCWLQVSINVLWRLYLNVTEPLQRELQCAVEQWHCWTMNNKWITGHLCCLIGASLFITKYIFTLI